MTMWDYAAQYPTEFVSLWVIALLAVINVADSVASAYKSRHENRGDAK